MLVRATDNPIPIPSALVVKNGSNVTALGCGIFGSVDWSQDYGLAQSIQSEEINLLNSFAPQPRQAA